MSSPVIMTTRQDFEDALSNFDVVPVHAIVNSPDIRPVDALRELSKSGAPSFIFESESPEVGASRFAYVCPEIENVIRTGDLENLGDIDPTTALRIQFASRRVAPVEGLPDLITGVFGFASYEAVKHFEQTVGELKKDPTGSPVSAFAIPATLLVFDRMLDQLHILVYTGSNQYETARNRIDEVVRAFSKIVTEDDGPDSELTQQERPASVHSNFESMVRSARESVIEGELIQVVLGQRVETRTVADPLDIYEHLSTLNPSPYMFMLDLGDMQLIGASPELMLRSTDGKVAVHPIAGTRPRGTTAEEDLQFEADLLSNEKESAEHVMLVDLARNDLGRVCEPGTVKVTSLKHIERYSHVMHLVSRVEGQLTLDNDGIDAFKAGFPIGTLSGAPKIRSIQLISELEHEGRGPYCGGIGWFGANGDVDTGTIIRSIVLRDGIAHVQGGAGIVFDSVPEAENQESLQKTKAPLEAIARAELQQELRWRNEDQIPTKISHAAIIAQD